MTFQIQNMEGFLKWLKTCPYEHTVSSMSGGFIHAKFFIPCERPDPLEAEPEPEPPVGPPRRREYDSYL